MRSLYCVSTAAGIVCSGLFLAYWFYRRTISTKKIINKVVFFPDKATAQLLCRKRNGATDLQGSSLLTLMESIQSAKQSLDVCMFTMASKELSEMLIRARKDRIVVRVITDTEQIGASGSRIGSLRRAGIQVRTDNSSFFMHHKFVVVDRQVLINGSLNWTLQGVCGNQENVLITSNSDLVTPFVKQFEQLWELYNPGQL